MAKQGGTNLIVIFFSHGFRTFFLAAGFYAVIVMVPWVIWVSMGNSGTASWLLPTDGPPHLWHAHEMIFGYAAAAIAGFLLTAVPSWTGADPVRGRLLSLLFFLWFCGRAIMWVTAILPTSIVAIVDLLFLPTLAAVAFWQLSRRPAPRNMLFFILLLGLFAANLLFHSDHLIGLRLAEPHRALRFGLDVVIVIITILGGRIVPAFTHNAAHQNALGMRLPKRYPTLDAVAVGLVAALAIANLTAPEPVSGVLALAAAAANAFRLYEWRSPVIARQPLIWVLHMGFAWVVAGLLLQGLAAFGLFTSNIAALHALSAGAIGTMTIAVMSRASLGHTGRRLEAPRPVVVAYVLIFLSALTRTFGQEFLPTLYSEIMFVSGATWIAAFLIFSIVYTPILLGPRARGRK